ncbi:uncharacterized protein LOC121730723 [Aricia agestis]|uniref:uncharacterized protein LOC121730723 n=1 Tax=Aricia agestis TaxID=91739 RepID=UPI001C20C145|nr:uncharacterized protein LOC121730723 [Aricia agestis]
MQIQLSAIRNFRETTTNLCPHFFKPGQCNGDHNINNTKIKMETTVVKEFDLPKFTNESELEIIKIYESKIIELMKQHSNSLDDLKQYYERLLGRLQIAYDNNITEKEGIIKNKDEEIARLNKSIEEMKTRTLCKKFSIQNIEQRLSKIEISTSKHLKKYQRKILKQRQKYIRDCSLLLDLLQQKSIDDTKDNPIDPCTNHLKKLEDKYKNIVAKVQATALQRMIQDQLAMETLVKKISRISFVCNKTSQMNNVHNKTKSKIEDPNTHEPNGVEVNDQMELKNNSELKRFLHTFSPSEVKCLVLKVLKTSLSFHWRFKLFQISYPISTAIQRIISKLNQKLSIQLYLS